MASEDSQTPLPPRSSSHASVDRTAVQEHSCSSGILETQYDNSNASGPSDLSSGSSAVATKMLHKGHGQSGGFLAERYKDDHATSNAATAVSTSGTRAFSAPGGGGGGRELIAAAIEGGDASNEFGDLADFVVVAGDKDRRGGLKLTRYDPEIDIPLPRRHAEVARAMVAKSAAGRQRSEIDASEVGTEGPSLSTSESKKKSSSHAYLMRSV